MRSPRMKLCWQSHIVIAVIFAAAFASGCQKQAGPNDTRTAIQSALRQHVSQQSNLNLAAMDMNIENVTMNGDHAQAQVQFRLRENNVTMEMLYQLEEHGGSWIVTHSQPAGGQFSHPPMDKTHSVQAQ